MGGRHRPRGARASQDEDEDVLPLRARIRRRREHENLPRVPRAPGRAAGSERACDRAHDQARPRARLRDLEPRDLRAQELLLSRPAEGLPDQPVRGPALRPGHVRHPDRRRRGNGRHRARASRGGRGEDGARGRRDRPERRRRLLARRLQPRRDAADRDRERAGPPLGRRGRPLPAPAAADDRRARRLRRGDGEGHAARGRERLGAKAWGGGLPAPLGAQEHELVHVHPPRHRGGGPRADRGVRARRGDRAVDVRLRPGHRPPDRAPLEGGGGRLPLLPGARSRADRAARGARRPAARRDRRAARGADPPSCRSRSASTSPRSSS